MLIWTLFSVKLAGIPAEVGRIAAPNILIDGNPDSYAEEQVEVSFTLSDPTATVTLSDSGSPLSAGTYVVAFEDISEITVIAPNGKVVIYQLSIETLD